jgi:hypothetical protein
MGTNPNTETTLPSLGTDGTVVSLGHLSLNAESFHVFYRLLVGMRFPLKVWTARTNRRSRQIIVIFDRY